MRPESCLVNAGQHFHQGGLTGAIFADQHMDLARAQLKLCMVECMNTRKGLVNPFHQNERVTHESPLRSKS